MNEYQPVEFHITRDEIEFRINNDPYRSIPDFSEQNISQLNNIRLDGSPSEYGEFLLKTAFTDSEGRQGLHHMMEEIRKGNSFQVQLYIDDDAVELHSLWWECLLYDKEVPHNFSTNNVTPLSRYMRVRGRKAIKAEKLRILFVISNPTDLGQEGGRWGKLSSLAVDDEVAVIKTAMDQVADRVDFHHILSRNLYAPASFANIQQALSDNNYHILHIIAHGDFVGDKGVLLLENHDDETAEPWGDVDLSDLVNNSSRNLQLVVLAACHSASRSNTDAYIGLAPFMIRGGLPAVIAMQDKIKQETARRFLSVFYNSLINSFSAQGMVDVSANKARQWLYNRAGRKTPSWEWAVPVLFMQGDGMLFESEQGEYMQPSGVGRVQYQQSQQPGQFRPSPGAQGDLFSARTGFTPDPGQPPGSASWSAGPPSESQRARRGLKLPRTGPLAGQRAARPGFSQGQRAVPDDRIDRPDAMRGASGTGDLRQDEAAFREMQASSDVVDIASGGSGDE